MKTEKEFLLARDDALNIKLGNYKNKIETLTGVIEVKEQLLEVIDRVLPTDYKNKIVCKAKEEDYVGKQMKLLEYQQSLLRKQVNRVIKGNPKLYRKPTETKRLIIDNKSGRASGE